MSILISLYLNQYFPNLALIFLLKKINEETYSFMVGWTRKKYTQLAKGFFGRMKNCIRVMVPKVERALKFAYRDRRVRPR